MNSRIKNLNLQELSLADLVGVTALRLESIADHLVFKPMKLTSASFRILRVLDKFGEMTPSEIINYLGGTKSNITQRLYHLNRSGLIKLRKPDTGDQRKIIASLTPHGIDSLKQVLKSFTVSQVGAENFFTPSELKNLSNFLIKLNKGLDLHEDKLLKI